MTRYRPVPLTDTRPSVSVVIPCYNYGRYLADAVTSVRGQPAVETQVIIVDDASPDGSAEVAAGLAAADPGVTLIRHEVNQGHIATFNEGLAAAEGDYVVLLSADDLLTPGALARACALMEAHPGVGFVYGHPLEFNDVPPPSVDTVRSWSVWSGREWFSRRCQAARNCIFSPEVVMRTSVLRAIGDYNAELPHSADFELWLRAAVAADVGRVNGPSQAYYRIHDQSMQRTVHAGHLLDFDQNRRAFDNVLAGPAGRWDDRDALWHAAHRGLARLALDAGCRALEEGGSPDSVDDYVAFALEVCPDARRLARYRGLERRRRSATRTGAHSSFVVKRAVRDLSSRVRWRRWRMSGL